MHYVKNRSKMMGSYNLPTTDEKGRRKSLILSQGETSRALTPEEFNFPEIQKGLANRDLLDVTKRSR